MIGQQNNEELGHSSIRATGKGEGIVSFILVVVVVWLFGESKSLHSLFLQDILRRDQVVTSKTRLLYAPRHKGSSCTGTVHIYDPHHHQTGS